MHALSHSLLSIIRKMVSQALDVRRAIQERDKESLVYHYDKIRKKLSRLPYLKENEFFDLVGTDLGKLNRNFSAEVYLPPTVLNGEPKRTCCAVR